MSELDREMIMVLLLLTVLLVTVVVVIFNCISRCKLFKKAGEKPWKALIPLYSGYIMCGFTWKTSMAWLNIALCAVNWFLILSNREVFGIRLINHIAFLCYMILRIMRMYRLSKAFGHGKGFTAGLALFDWIFIPALAFGRSRYAGNTYIDEII